MRNAPRLKAPKLKYHESKLYYKGDILKVFHFILGKANKNRANGVNQVIAGLAKYSIRLGAEVRIIGKANSAEMEGKTVHQGGFDVIVYTKWSKALREAVHEAIEWADIVHLHGVYSLSNHWVGRICTAEATPYIVTVHGGLAAERKRSRGTLRKTIYHALLQKNHLAQAAAIHIVAEEERIDVIQEARPKKLICIPNGVDLEDFPSPSYPSSQKGDVLRIGYLGRLAREKNLGALCEAFAAINTSGGMELLLAGPESADGARLKQEYAAKGVVLVGPKFGQEKADFLNSLDVFVLPSLSEGSPISAMEVLASAVPLLVTCTSNMSHYAASRGFYMCEPTVFSLEKGLIRVLEDREEWGNVARRGRVLIETRLNWETSASQMLAAYDDICGVVQ